MENVDQKPYVIRSGKYQGKYLEELLFEDFEFLRNLMGSRATDYDAHKHLQLLMNKAPETILKCPICHDRNVKYFLFLNSANIMESLTCCENDDCKKFLKSNHPNDYLLPIKFSSLGSLRNKGLRNKAADLIRHALGLGKKSTPGEILQAILK